MFGQPCFVFRKNPVFVLLPDTRQALQKCLGREPGYVARAAGSQLLLPQSQGCLTRLCRVRCPGLRFGARYAG
jgi:hypothetical protein